MAYGRLVTFLAVALALAGAAVLSENHYAQAVWLVVATALIFGWRSLVS